jgi:type IV secretory pathway TraG/TraD family ATPase VirD4
MLRKKVSKQKENRFDDRLDELVQKHETDQIILGEGSNCVFSTDCKETGLNNNVLVVGGSGSGKTMSVAEPFLLESFRRSIITTVTKRKIVKKYTPLLRSRGYEVWDLDFVHPERGNIAYDPLDYISSYSDITFVARSVVMANPKKERSNADPYWDEAATSLFAAIIAYVLMTKDNANFADALEMLDKLTFEDSSGQIKTNFDRKFEYLEENDSSNYAVSNWKSFKKLPIRTASCVFGTLNTTVDTVFSPELRSMFRMKKKVDFELVAKEPISLFVTSSPVNPATNCFINMFYGHAFKQLFEFGEEQPDGMLPRPVHFLADDFATGCSVPLFDQYISIFREKRISVILLIQSESQLSSLYGAEEATTIINNCDTYVFMGSNDLATAQNISLRVNRPLEDVLQMKIGNQILIRRGARPKMGKRYNIFENETYRKVTAAYEQHITEERKLEKGENAI